MLAPNLHSPNTFAAIYCRISSDKSGLAAGVERQEADCRALAERLGLIVLYVFTDNDLSAYSGKPRPQYLKLLEAMKSGDIDTVLSFHQDRLQRSPVELETYVDVSEVGKVTTHTVLAGHIDLSTPTGRFNARIIGAAARYEVEHMIERQQAAKLQAAIDGKYLGGQRPYGFEDQRSAIREDEAQVIREMAYAITNGRSFWALSLDLNERGILTQHGKTWNAAKVRNVLIRPINVGIVHHKGIDYPAKSPAILTPDEWGNMMVAIQLSRTKSPHPGRFRKYMLNRLLYCGICGGKMYHKSKQQRDGSYKPTTSCGKTSPDTGKFEGCGGVSRMVAPIEDLITDAVLYRLESPQLATALHKSKTSANTLSDLTTQQRALEARISEITDDYYENGLLTREQFERMKGRADAELAAISKQIAAEYSDRTVIDFDLSGDIRAAWEVSSLEQKRSLLFGLIKGIHIDPRPKVEGYKYPKYKSYRFDPSLIRIEWKV